MQNILMVTYAKVNFYRDIIKALENTSPVYWDVYIDLALEELATVSHILRTFMIDAGIEFRPELIYSIDEEYTIQQIQKELTTLRIQMYFIREEDPTHSITLAQEHIWQAVIALGAFNIRQLVKLL